MTSPTPPTTRGALERREARLAWSLLLPTILIVSLVIILPLLSIFWISFKPVGLADLRPVAPVIRESLRERSGQMVVEYRVRNSSQQKEIAGLGFTDTLHDGVKFLDLPEACSVDGRTLRCDFGDVPGGFNERLRIPVALDGDVDTLE
ncbi:MAG: sugar ABC transporter permease, partial [Pseudomonadota bacterium]